MSQNETASKSFASTGKLEVVDKDKEGNFIVKHRDSGHICTLVDTFAEMFPLWAGRILITADNEKWAMTAAAVATGFATSVIMSPAEAGVEGIAPKDATPDGRGGVLIQIYNRDRFELRNQMVLRIGQCVMTCPTASAFDALANAKRKLKIGRSIQMFGDGFQRKGFVGERKVWKIPVMEGDFIVEDAFGAAEAVAGGNFLILAKDRASGLRKIAPTRVQARLSRRVVSPPGVRSFIRVRVRRSADGSLRAEPVRVSGSSITSSMVRSNGILEVPEPLEGFEEGSTVTVELFKPLEA